MKKIFPSLKGPRKGASLQIPLIEHSQKDAKLLELPSSNSQHPW